jgi:hypothetical protein
MAGQNLNTLATSRDLRAGCLKSHHLFFCLLTILHLLNGCGRFTKESSDSLSLSLPDYVEVTEGISNIEPGSLDVKPSKDPGILVPGPMLLRLYAEDGAKIFFDYKPFEITAAARPFEKELLLYPPATIWARAEKGGKLGPLKTFNYTLDESVYGFSDVVATKLPPTTFKEFPLSTGQEIETFEPDDVGGLSKPFVADGIPDEWSGVGRQMVRDSANDVPLGLSATDVRWVQATETDDAILVAIGLGAQPIQAERVAYGFEVGASNVDADSFGLGADYFYKVELRHTGVQVSLKDADTALEISANSIAKRKDIVEFHILKSDLPKLNGIEEIVLRAFAVDWASGTTVFDRVDPLYMRSKFQLNRATIPLPGDRFVDYNFHVDPSFPSQFAKDSISYVSDIFSELEAFNRMPLYGTGYSPTFYVAKDENGYAGLNTTDRGILTTVGPLASPMHHFQLLAHEFAHFQNARNSALDQRWIQEGMSEWSAERLLYNHFPTRSVYRILKRLRFDRYNEVVDGGEESIPLDRWGEENSDIGYEKSLMFMDLLEAKLGSEAMHAAFLQAMNQPMKSNDFLEFLTIETGEDVKSMFDFWVFEGDAAPGMAPDETFRDSDGDVIMDLDEALIGTDPKLFDTDGDGYNDGEEYFRKLDPLTSKLSLGSKTQPILVNKSFNDTSAFFRLGGHPGTTFKYSLNSETNSPTTDYVGSRMMRAPYSVAVQGQSESSKSSVQTLTRPLYIKNKVVNHSYVNNLILPTSPKTTETFETNITLGTDIGVTDADFKSADFQGDLPSWLSAYDIIDTTITESDETITVSLKTKSPPDRYGSFGDYVIAFDTLDVTESAIDQERRYVMNVSDGSHFWHVYKNGKDTSGIPPKGFQVSYSDTLDLTIDRDQLSAWLDSGEGQQLCVWTKLELDREYSFKERGGCLMLKNPGFTRVAASMASQFEVGNHLIEVFMETSDYTAARALDARTTALSAIRQFERALARPLLDRNLWMLHLHYTDGLIGGSGDENYGAWLAAPSSLDDEEYEHLIVEQLARLHTSDIMEREASLVPYWMQEAYVQWLTASAMYQMYPTTKVHEFHESRIDDYLCYTKPSAPGQCLGKFSGDVYLSSWNGDTASGSTASVKSLMLMLMLDALVGSDVMGEIFATFSNGFPSTSGLKQMFKDYSASNSAAIDELWELFVDGSGSSSNDVTDIRAELVDGDGDGLYLYEERKLGLSDASNDPYLN